MADLNKEALDIWGSLKPMIDEEIASRTQGMVQRRKAKVTTAPSLVTNTIGVTEAFGQEIFLPFVTNIASAKVGDFVWIEWMYGASNAFVSCFAEVDEKDFTVAGVLDVVPRRCYATLSSAGWYRVMDVNVANVNASKFSVATIVDINIGTEYWANSNGTHKISLHGVFNNVAFLGEESKSNNMLVSKIRYTYDSSGNGHIDIYYTGTSGNPVWCTFAVHMPYSYQYWFVANNLTAVAASPSGETVLTEYTFAANVSAASSIELAVQNRKVTSDVNSKTSYTFNVPTSAGNYGHFLMYGGTAADKAFLYIGFIGADNSVVLFPAYNTNSNITFSATYNGSTLTITSNSTCWGGIHLISVNTTSPAS